MIRLFSTFSNNIALHQY